MMNVKSYKILTPNLVGSTGYTINVPIDQTTELAGQEDIIQRKFVDVEVENAINPIVDYEKVKLLPKNNSGTLTNSILYTIHMLDNGTYPSNTFWADIGFTYEDFLFNKNGFTKSFLRLDFYDSDITASQRLLFFISIFPKFLVDEYNNDGTPPFPTDYDLSFTLGNTILDREANGEGFGLYHFKDEVLPTVNKELFMRSSFANAKTGKVTRFMATNNPSINIQTLIRTTNGRTPPIENNLHTKYILKREASGYYYIIDDEYSPNVVNNTNNYTINLYEISST